MTSDQCNLVSTFSKKSAEKSACLPMGYGSSNGNEISVLSLLKFVLELQHPSRLIFCHYGLHSRQWWESHGTLTVVEMNYMSTCRGKPFLTKWNWENWVFFHEILLQNFFIINNHILMQITTSEKVTCTK